MKLFFLLSTLLITISFSARCQEEWDVNSLHGPGKTVSFSTEEGTWMNLDVSPNGETIVFDLLGDIYQLPIDGGIAKLIKGGRAYQVQPRFSPDGKSILYTSDAGGGDNIWKMDKNGNNAEQLTDESFRLLNNADWTPDGEYFVARKHFTGTRSLGAGEIWMYHKTGGSGIQLTKRKNDQQDVNEPCVSPDGRFVYYSEDIYPGGYFKYNKDPNSQIYVIKKYDRETGETNTEVSGPGGAVRPQISPDGKHLAFVKRVRTKSVLYLRELKSGREWPIFDKLSKDQQEAWAIFGVYTGFDFTPNGNHIVIWGKGKLWKVNIHNSEYTEIPFKADVKLEIEKALRYEQNLDSDKFTARAIRHAITSPDGKWLVFNAAGYLWKKELPNGKASRLTKQTYFEFEPSFSPDGKHLVFVNWSDTATGSIMKMKFPNGKAEKISSRKGMYREPAFSHDGEKIVYRRESGNRHMGYSFTQDPGLYYMSSDGRESHKIISHGSKPQFTKTGEAIYFMSGGGLNRKFKKVNLNGTDEIELFHSKYTNRFIPSPDEKWIAFKEHFKVYIAPFPKSGQSVKLSSKTTKFPISQVARDAGYNLHWSANSEKLHWTMGDEFFTVDIKKRFTFLENSVDSVPPPDSTGIKINLKLERNKPKGLIALKGGRIIKMTSEDDIIEEGTILVKDNRIIEIGKSEDIQIPDNAEIIDCKGKTLMPGLVDVHAHMFTFRLGLSPQQQWAYFANLAYGVTTTHDPSANSEMTFSQSEMVRAGNMVGPRIFSTGHILYGADSETKAIVNSYEDAYSNVYRTKRWGAFSVKSYNQPRRNQRQQVIKAARDLNMMVVPEGGSFFYHNMTMIIDGHTGVEHNIPVSPAYNDVVNLWSASETGYTPTLIVNYGGVNGEYYWYQKTNVWEKDKLYNFIPREIIDSRARHRKMIPDEEYEIGHISSSKTCKKLTDAGVKVNLGSHGQLQGLGAHWELWMLQQGGMTNYEALRAATYNGAHYIGLDKEVGTLEKGKLADILILNSNPLENIRNSEDLKFTMINGALYNSETMEQVYPVRKEPLPFFWQSKKYAQQFDWYQETNSFVAPKCGCTH